MSSRILIITAAFGEGHNSAARNLGLALSSRGAEIRVEDPCVKGAPRSTQFLQWGYRLVTTHYPKWWARMYQQADQQDFSRRKMPFMRKPEDYLEELLREYRPDAVVTTYPLYPYFLDRIFRKMGKRLPVFTVVTDSIEINAAWLKATSDWFLVTDPATRQGMCRAGIPLEKLVDTGFPVNPSFSQLQPVSPEDDCEVFRVLYFPTANLKQLVPNGEALLGSSPKVRLTLVLGKNVRLLYRQAAELKRRFPGRVRVIGWTRKVPELLNRHHLVVGKAGGATVHEAIAACCPMWIHHLVPGQEEGNLKLLESIGAGCLADTPQLLASGMADLLADHASSWRKMKFALVRHGRHSGALLGASFVLEKLQQNSS